MPAILLKIASIPHLSAIQEMTLAVFFLSMNIIFAEFHHILGGLLLLLQLGYGYVRFRIKQEELKKIKRENEDTK